MQQHTQGHLKGKDSSSRFGWLDAMPAGDSKFSESDAPPTPTMAAIATTPSRRHVRDIPSELVVGEDGVQSGQPLLTVNTEPPAEGGVVRRKKRVPKPAVVEEQPVAAADVPPPAEDQPVRRAILVIPRFVAHYDSCSPSAVIPPGGTRCGSSQEGAEPRSCTSPH